jgi:hypothetical protein
MSCIIVNGKLQPRLLAFLGYGALATITANRAARDRDDKEAEESKEKIKEYRHRRGQLCSSFCDHAIHAHSKCLMLFCPCYISNVTIFL